MMERAIASILKRHGPVWGVVSDRYLLPWYASLGAELRSPLVNKDGLWVVSWPHRHAEN
jgi:hypothetical protein